MSACLGNLEGPSGLAWGKASVFLICLEAVAVFVRSVHGIVVIQATRDESRFAAEQVYNIRLLHTMSMSVCWLSFMSSIIANRVSMCIMSLIFDVL